MKTEEEKLKKKLNVTTTIIVLLLIVLLVILSIVLIRIFSVKDGINNNDSNMGLVTQSDDYVFFYDYSKGLVKKNKDGSKALTNDSAYSLQYLDGNIYYATPNANGGMDIKKITSDGKNEKVLISIQTNSTKIYLQDNKIYYLTSNPDTISRIDLNGENEEVVLKRSVIDFKVVDNTIYFADMMGYLNTIDTDGKNYKTIIKESIFSEFQILKNYVYYFNSNDSKLVKINLKNTKERQTVTDKLDCNIYNVTTNGIYYFNKGTSKICYVSLNGKDSRDIVKVNTENTNINIVGTNLYYIDNKDGLVVTKVIGTNGKKIK